MHGSPTSGQTTTGCSKTWLRWLPVASREITPGLASLIDVRRLSEADASRIEHLLVALRAKFETGEIDPERRSNSFASQTFVGLHWRLYQQLADQDPAGARAVLDRVGVLATRGRTLVYLNRDGIRHDDGTDTGFRRFFSAQVPFSILPKDLGPTADHLAIERFHVEVERIGGGPERDVTAEVRPYIHVRAAELLALQVFHPIGTRALQLDGNEFPVRAERLRSLRVSRVDDLVLRISLPGLGLAKDIGAGSGDDLYLDDRKSPATLYTDLAGAGWEGDLRKAAGSYLATLLDNSAYGATYQLLLQAESDAAVEAFLEDLSVSPEDVEVVRSRIAIAAGEVLQEERRWWRAVLAELGASARRTLKMPRPIGWSCVRNSSLPLLGAPWRIWLIGSSSPAAARLLVGMADQTARSMCWSSTGCRCRICTMRSATSWSGSLAARCHAAAGRVAPPSAQPWPCSQPRVWTARR